MRPATRTAESLTPTLQFAFADRRIVLTNNRRDFMRLHRSGVLHEGIIIFTLTNVDTLHDRIHAALNVSPTGRFFARVDGIGFRPDEL
jgi:hypothetical protein